MDGLQWYDVFATARGFVAIAWSAAGITSLRLPGRLAGGVGACTAEARSAGGSGDAARRGRGGRESPADGGIPQGEALRHRGREARSWALGADLEPGPVPPSHLAG